MNNYLAEFLSTKYDVDFDNSATLFAEVQPKLEGSPSLLHCSMLTLIVIVLFGKPSCRPLSLWCLIFSLWFFFVSLNSRCWNPVFSIFQVCVCRDLLVQKKYPVSCCCALSWCCLWSVTSHCLHHPILGSRDPDYTTSVFGVKCKSFVAKVSASCLPGDGVIAEW